MVEVGGESSNTYVRACSWPYLRPRARAKDLRSYAISRAFALQKASSEFLFGETLLENERIFQTILELENITVLSV